MSELDEPVLDTGPTPASITEGGIRPAPFRIYRVTFRSGMKRKVVSVLMKIPYGGVFAMMAVLSRALSFGQIKWFRVEVPETITDEQRKALLRWPEALASTTEATEVSWTA